MRRPTPGLLVLGLAPFVLAACTQGEDLLLSARTPAKAPERAAADPPLRPVRKLDPAAACLDQLRARRVAFTQIADRRTRHGCGYEDAVRMTAIGDVALSKPIVLRCQMARRVADWLQGEVQPAARQVLNTRVTRLLVSSAYRCRRAFGLRSRKGYRLSQHARANAFDIWGMEFANGRRTRVRDHWKFNLRRARAVARARAERVRRLSKRQQHRMYKASLARQKVRDARERRPRMPRRGDIRGFWRYVALRACNMFNKVFTPESDWFHRHHLHFDLAKNRICGIHGEWTRPVPRIRYRRRLSERR